MKLSEILSKPFKVKGGGTVNLKGLSKHIVDKEVGGNSDTDSIFNKIYNLDMIPYNTKVVYNNTIVNLPDTPDNGTYYFLYKKSDFSTGKAMISFNYTTSPKFSVGVDSEIRDTYNIDGEEYVTLIASM